MTHLTFEEISELAEGREPRAESRAPHLAECPECRATLLKVRDLIAAARALPRDVAPPPEVWAALQSRVGSRSSGRAAASRWRSAWYAAAAVLVLAVGMTLLMPSRDQKAKAKGARGPVPDPSPMLVLNVEKNYASTVAELRQTLDAQRKSLSPATIRVLEHSLAAIDTAIAEAREALANDPANQTLVGILSANYQRKVELLQRATQLPSSS